MKQIQAEMYLTGVDLEDGPETLVVDSTHQAPEDPQSAERQRIVARHLAAVAEHQRYLEDLERRLTGCNG